MATEASSRTIGPADVGSRMTLDEFLAASYPEGFLCELARGVLVELEMPELDHGMVVMRIADLFFRFEDLHPGRISYGSSGANCRIMLPGLQSCRRPDQAIYFLPNPPGKRVWHRWVPQIVVEVIYHDSEHRDYVEKREEYLQFGVVEYWIFDRYCRRMRLHKREGDTWFERDLPETAEYRTELLPGLVVSVGEILGPAGEEEIDEVEGPGEDDLPPAS